MTGLRLVAADTSLDSAGRARKRDSVLRLYRLTPITLESAASRLATRPDHAVQLLRAIDQNVAKVSNKNVAPPAAPHPVSPAPAAPPARPGTPATKPSVTPAQKPSL